MRLLRILKISFVCCLLAFVISAATFAQEDEFAEMGNVSTGGYFDDIVYLMKDIPLYKDRLHLGPVQINPSLKISETFDDNVFDVHNDKVGDFFSTYDPGIILALPFKDHSLEIDYHAGINDYSRHYTRAEDQDNVSQSLAGALNLNFNNGFSISFSNQISASSIPGGVERRVNPLVIFDDEDVPDIIESPEEFGINDFINKRNITTNIAAMKIDFPDYFNNIDFDLHYSNRDIAYQRPDSDDNEHNDDIFGVAIEIKPFKKINIITGFDYKIIRYDSDSGKDSIARQIPFEISWETTAKSMFFFRTRYNTRDYGNESIFKSFSGYDATLGYRFDISEKDNLTVKFERSLKEQQFRNEQRRVRGVTDDAGDPLIVKVGDDNPYFFTQFNIDYVHRFSKKFSFIFSPYIQTLRFKEKVNVTGDNGRVVSSPREKIDAVGLAIKARYDAPNKWFFAEISYNYQDRNNNLPGDDLVRNVGKISIGLNF